MKKKHRVFKTWAWPADIIPKFLIKITNFLTIEAWPAGQSAARPASRLPGQPVAGQPAGRQASQPASRLPGAFAVRKYMTSLLEAGRLAGRPDL